MKLYYADNYNSPYTETIDADGIRSIHYNEVGWTNAEYDEKHDVYVISEEAYNRIWRKTVPLFFVRRNGRDEPCLTNVFVRDKEGRIYR